MYSIGSSIKSFRHEDRGQNSYIIFRPEQVFSLTEKTKEHIVPGKTQEQKDFLWDAEWRFFQSQQPLSPSQRIQNHLKLKLQKKKNISSKSKD